MNRYAKQNIENELKEIKAITDKYHIVKTILFGSYARGEAKRSSDIDICLDNGSEIDAEDFLAIQDEISEAVDKQVDVLDYHYHLNPNIKYYINLEGIVL